MPSCACVGDHPCPTPSLGSCLNFISNNPAIRAESGPEETQAYADDSLVKAKMAADRVGMKSNKDFISQVPLDYL